MTAPAKPADNLAEQEHQKTVFDMTTSEFEAACQKRPHRKRILGWTGGIYSGKGQRR